MTSEPTRVASLDAAGEERPPRTVLVAEDSDDFRELLTVFLSGRGYEVLAARDGREAVAFALRHRPALVLMDVGLPGFDGLSAAREIRGSLTTAEAAILVVSAYDSAELRAEALEAGCDGYMVKPVDPEALLRTVELLLGRANDGEAVTV